jgi:hypothetical protein
MVDAQHSAVSRSGVRRELGVFATAGSLLLSMFAGQVAFAFDDKAHAISDC